MLSVSRAWVAHRVFGFAAHSGWCVGEMKGGIFVKNILIPGSNFYRIYVRICLNVMPFNYLGVEWEKTHSNIVAKSRLKRLG